MVNHPRRNKRAAAAVVSRAIQHDHDFDYAMLLQAVSFSFDAAKSRGPLFTTNTEGLFEIYLSHLGDERGVHSCSACRRFIENFGALVGIKEDGFAFPVMWGTSLIPEFYQPAVAAMQNAIARSRVNGVFLSSKKIWGVPITGEWTHFAVHSPSIYQNRLLTPGQAMAAKREDFVTVARALADFKPDMLVEALRLLEAAHLARSERFISPVRWLLDLQTKRAAAKDARVRDNILWLAVATAPEGYCHPRSSMVGTLLEDIAAGLSFEEVKARFDSKMHPLQYQRPQAAPSAGNLAEAEKIVAKLGIAPSLERRFARLDEVQPFWMPAAAKEAVKSSGGVFAHLTPKGAAPVRPLDAPPSVMTWDKFARTILPGAEAIEVAISHGNMNFCAMTTAANADAPNILKWDNPVSSYVYHGGSPASNWNLRPGFAKVVALTALPNLWGENPQPHLMEGVIIVIEGCADQRSGQGNALFPEILRDDLRPVRAVIEAYSKTAELAGRETASACGLAFNKGSKGINYVLRVAAQGRKTDYQIDRWD